MNNKSQVRTVALAVLVVAVLLCVMVAFMAGLVGGSVAYFVAQNSGAATSAAKISVAPTATADSNHESAIATPASTTVEAVNGTPSEQAALRPSQARPVPKPEEPVLGDSGGLTVTPRTTQQRATATPGGQAVSPELTLRQQMVFDRLWNVVNEKYVYADFNGVNWPAERIRITALVSSGISDAAFYNAMHMLIDSLHDDHSNFQTPAESAADDDRRKGTGTYVGIGITTDLNERKHYVYVLQVKPGSPAEKAGILPHDHILEVEGSPSVDADGHAAILLLRGPSGTAVNTLIETPGQAPRPVTITRGQIINSASVEYHLIPGTKRVGYILLPTFSEDNIQLKVRAVLKDLMLKGQGSLDGLIIDVRLNGGGQFRELTAIEGFFTTGRMGRLVTRGNASTSNFSVRAENVGNSQTVPLIILTSRSTASAAEVFAGSLQAAKRARIGGAKSSGNIEALFSYKFEDGSVLWLAEQAFQLPDGRSWEGKGLIPDLPVAAEWDEFTGNNDPVINAAAQDLGK